MTTTNKTTSLFLMLLLFFSVAAHAQNTVSSSAAVPAKDDDRGYIVKQLRGKIVILQFTASWCGVCRKEMPHLETEVWQAYKNKNVVLIGVDRDEPLEKVQKFAKDMKITYPLALDPGADIFGLFALKQSGVTRNVVIDQKGKIVYLTRLYNTEEFNQMVKVIDGLATAKASASK
eukprot:gene14988-18149_t